MRARSVTWARRTELSNGEAETVIQVRGGFIRAPLALALLTALACGAEPGTDDTDAAPAPQDPEALVGSWVVMAIVAANGEETTPVSGATPTLEFTDEAEPTGSRVFSGSGGCNRLRGSYDAGTTGRISFGSTASTEMACPEPVMQIEQRVVAALGSATRYDVEGDRLRIDFDGGAILLVRG